MSSVELKEVKIYHNSDQEDFLEELLDWCDSRQLVDDIIAYRSYSSSTELFCSENLAQALLKSEYECEEL